MATQLEKRVDRIGHGDKAKPSTRERIQENGVGQQQTQEPGARWLELALGWFSMGLGLAEIIAPRRVGELVGVEDDPTAFRLVGLREIVSGIGILTQPSPAGWLWSRVAGDMMDLALLGTKLDSDNPGRGRTAVATAAVVGVTALDLLASRRLSDRSNARSSQSGQRGVQVRQAVTVNCPVREVYDFWSNFKNLPRFMSHLGAVEITGPKRSHWRTALPAGFRAEWDAEIVDERPNELVSWRSLPASEVDTAGSVRFRPAPGNRGTEVLMELRYQPPLGALGAALAKLLGEGLEVLLERDLLASKQVIEVGEVVHSDASIHRGPHPARPFDEAETEERDWRGQPAHDRTTQVTGAWTQ